ncbi:tetraspanin-4-like isoform X2 [Littorina saxatilis]|uniref:tetraspanin-4-like isoform X2 n=1 Tax=Littorina saxatilis TaxID=31220 RepID=UPI0038B5A867
MADHRCHDPSCTRHPIKPANMGEKISFSCVKYIFFGFNVFIWLLGCGVLSLGVWLQINRSPHISILPTHAFLSASALCITAGAIILLVGFLGCCGAFYENQCMLIGYFIMVLLIFTLEITAGALGFLHKDELRSVIEKDLLTSIQQDYKTVSHPSGPSNQRSPSRSRDPEEWWLVMDSLQVELQCCGVNNYSDWFNIGAWPSERRVPDSCCRHPEDGCGKLEPRFWFDRGCMGEIDYWFVKNMYILGVVGITVAVVQILGMVAAIVLFCYIRNNKFFL